MTTDFLPRARWWGLALAVFPLCSQALEIEPSIELAQVYSTNIDLAPSGFEDSDWGTRVAPSVTATYIGSALQLNLDYTLEAWFYADDSERNAVYNQLDSGALLDLIGKDLQLDVRAVLGQANLSPEQPVTNSNFYTTGNRSDYSAWYAGPVWRRNITGTSEIDGLVTVGRVNFSDDALQDVDVVSGRFSVHTDPELDRTVSYDLAYEYDKLDYEISGEALVQTAYLQLAYDVRDSLEVFGLVGFDNEIADAVDTSLSDSRWEVGFRTGFGANRLEASIGNRYFGTTYGFAWDLVLPAAAFRISYSEQPSTSDLVSLREISATTPPGDETLPPADSQLGRPGNPTRLIYKRGDAVGTWTWPRSQLSVDFFVEKRDEQVQVTSVEGAASGVDDENAYGVVVGFRWEIGSRSIASLGASWTDREFNDYFDSSCEAGVGSTCDVLRSEDEQLVLRAGVDYRLGLRTTLGFLVGYQELSGGPTAGYDEYAAGVRLERTF